MRTLISTELEQVENFKKSKKCEKVFVDTTYINIIIFPIYNEAQELFVREIFENETYSRFDRLINKTLESKIDNLSDLISFYENELDML